MAHGLIPISIPGASIASGIDLGGADVSQKDTAGSGGTKTGGVFKADLIPFQLTFGTPIRSKDQYGWGLGLLVSPEIGFRKYSKEVKDNGSVVIRLRAGASLGMRLDSSQRSGLIWPNVNLYGLVEDGGHSPVYGGGIDIWTTSGICPGLYVEATDNPTTGEQTIGFGARGVFPILWEQ